VFYVYAQTNQFNLLQYGRQASSWAEIVCDA